MSNSGNITNNTTNHNTQNILFNIVAESSDFNDSINDLGKENLIHITNEYKKSCLMKLYPGMKEFIKSIHFNKNCPENQNIHYKSSKQKLLYIKKDGRWMDANKNTTFDEVIRNGYQTLFETFRDNCHSDSDLQQNSEIFIKYFNELMEGKNQKYYNMRNDLFLMAKDNTFLMLGVNPDEPLQIN